MNATKLNKSELFSKIVLIHLRQMNPRITRTRVKREPWCDLSCLNAVDQLVLWCTISFAVWALGVWELVQ